MPNRHYRKITKRLINRGFESKNEINTIQQYFFDVIDSIILYSDMNISIKEIQSLIKFISSKEEVYILLDKIESIIEGIIVNIHEDISVGIINERITYVRGLLSSLPDNFNNYAEISFLILNIIETITKSVDFNTVYSNIIYIEQLMSIDMDVYESIQLIHLTILSIITNIGDGESEFIINERISYLQTLINKLSQ
jgi:hypothetical protein